MVLIILSINKYSSKQNSIIHSLRMIGNQWLQIIQSIDKIHFFWLVLILILFGNSLLHRLIIYSIIYITKIMDYTKTIKKSK